MSSKRQHIFLTEQKIRRLCRGKRLSTDNWNFFWVRFLTENKVEKNKRTLKIIL